MSRANRTASDNRSSTDAAAGAPQVTGDDPGDTAPDAPDEEQQEPEERDEPLAIALAAAQKRYGAEAIRAQARLSRDTYFRFRKTGAGSARTRVRLWEAIHEVGLRGPPGASESQTPDRTPDRTGIGSGMLHRDGSVTLSAQTYGYLIGRLESMAEAARGGAEQAGAAARTAQAMSTTAEAMSEMLLAMRGTIARAAEGMSGLVTDRLEALRAAEELAADLDEASGRALPAASDGAGNADAATRRGPPRSRRDTGAGATAASAGRSSDTPAHPRPQRRAAGEG